MVLYLVLGAKFTAWCCDLKVVDAERILGLLLVMNESVIEI